MPSGNYRAEINPGRVGPWSGDLSNQHRPTLPGLANRVAETGGMCPRLFMENHSVVYCTHGCPQAHHLMTPMPQETDLLKAAEQVAKLLAANGVPSLVIGAIALASHRCTRCTQQITAGATCC